MYGLLLWTGALNFLPFLNLYSHNLVLLVASRRSYSSLSWIASSSEVGIAVFIVVVQKTATVKNLAWVGAPVTWGVVYGWFYIIWLIEVMASVLVSGEFLIDLPECIYLFPDVFIWMVNWLYYLNYEDIPRSSSTCHWYVQVTSLGQTVSSYGWCNIIPRFVPFFSSFLDLPRLTIFLTEVKRFFHVSILSLSSLGKSYAYDRLSYK